MAFKFLSETCPTCFEKLSLTNWYSIHQAQSGGEDESKFLFVVAVSLLTSCKTYTPKKASFYYTDYKSWYDEGFFITESSTVPFDYVPVGSLLVVNRWSEKVIETVNKDTLKLPEPSDAALLDDIYDEDPTIPRKPKTKVSLKAPTAESALREAKAFAEERGADGIMNCRIIYDSENVEVSGMLFKRKVDIEK